MGPGGLRPAQEPLSEPTWAFCTSTWARQPDLGFHETSKRHLGAILERFRSRPGGPGSPKNTVKYNVFAVFHVAPQTTPRSSKSARLGAARDAPGAAQKAPRAPKASQERPQSRPKTPSERPWPTGTEKPSKGPSLAIFNPPPGRFCILRGSIVLQFSSLG